MKIFKSTLIPSLVLTLGGYHSTALADCAGGSLADVKQAYANAQKFEARGQNEAALAAYVEAQEYICEKNPYEQDAARKAASLSAALAAAAERKADFESAHRLYEAGGHYAKSDAALIVWIRSVPDNPAAFAQARAHFDGRALESFRSNNALRLAITGAYSIDPIHIASLHAMPAAGMNRALKQDAEAFDETYLHEYVALIEARPEYGADGANVFDQAALQRAADAHQAFARKWPEDPLKKSRARLEILKRWGEVSNDEALAASALKSYRERINHHADVIAQRYAGAPKLLGEAVDYLRMLGSEDASANSRIKSVQSVANKLGEGAQSKRRYTLAAEYFEVADEDAKARAARDSLKLAMQAKMQPSIDAMQRQAAQLQAQFSDPEQVKGMKAQAEAARTGLQQPAARKVGKSAADLEKELGL